MASKTIKQIARTLTGTTEIDLYSGSTEGEDLYGIAIRWGCSPADLKALNNLTGSDLKPGTVLKIPN
jgi:LysM repeat protein